MDEHTAAKVSRAFQSGLPKLRRQFAEDRAALAALASSRPEPSVDALRAALTAFVDWWDSPPYVTSDDGITEQVAVLRAALASSRPEPLDVETVARAYRDAAERSSTTHDLLAQMTVNLNAALGGAS